MSQVVSNTSPLTNLAVIGRLELCHERLNRREQPLPLLISVEQNKFLRYMDGRMILKAIIHQAEEGGFWAEVPALPGCATQGETLGEVRANLREAVEGWLSVESLEVTASAGDLIIEVAV